MPSSTNLIRNGYDSGCVSLHTPPPFGFRRGSLLCALIARLYFFKERLYVFCVIFTGMCLVMAFLFGTGGRIR